MTSFVFINGYDEYTVPAGVTRCVFVLRGAAGGNAHDRTDLTELALGGLGGLIVVEADTTPGEVLRIYCGGMGDPGSVGPSPTYVGAAGLGGFNGGANGGHVNTGNALSIPAGGGGGKTDIRRDPYTSADIIVVAGAGGGAGGNGTFLTTTISWGGDAGYTDGDPGFDGATSPSSSNGGGGGGGTATAGGAGGHATVGVVVDGSPGAAHAGGAGAALLRGGGGGGAGHYGGGGGGASNTAGTSGGGGGGGSSWFDSATATLIAHGLQSTRDHGTVEILPVTRRGRLRGGLHMSRAVRLG